MSIPYTYLVYCKPTKQFYYGVRYAKNCNPSDLWSSYFTSSSYVKNLIRLYGKDAFEYQIRKVFETSYEARQWEQKVLQRLKVTSRKDFINKSTSGFPNKGDFVWIKRDEESLFIDKISLHEYIQDGWTLGRVFSQLTKEKISKSRKSQNFVNIPNHSIEQRKKWSENRKGRINGRDTSKPVMIDGVFYTSMKKASKATNLSYYKIAKYYLI